MKEKCVTCGEETLYDREDHIDTRLGYVEGSGQLCLDCDEEIYIKKEKPKISFVKIGRRGKEDVR